MMPPKDYVEPAGDDQSSDRVRRSTSSRLNEEIDRQTDLNIQRYMFRDDAAILRRLDDLDQEWDIERVLQVYASTLAMSGLVLGLKVDRRWFAMPAVVMSFLFLHGVQGWCPPLPILRRLGVRTRSEIEREKFILKSCLTRH